MTGGGRSPWWRIWCGLLWGLLASLSSPAAAHELTLDQLLLWPDAAAGRLRGQLTLDPELTRSLDAPPSAAAGQRLLSLIRANLTLSADARPLSMEPELRELWVRGGATLGDLVVFSAPLPPGASELRVLTGEALTALVVSVQEADGTGSVSTHSWLLRGGEASPAYRLGAGGSQPGWRAGGPDLFQTELAPAPASPPDRELRTTLAARFVRLGFEHILPGGLDHVLFVAGLVLGSRGRLRRVLVSLSLFTLAHTLTLALGGVQRLGASPRLVEPLIALSIVALGVDNLRARRAPERHIAARGVVVFGFGLIHGLGFAGALSELSFERSETVLALLSFNAGVELGQAVVASALALVLYLLRSHAVLTRRAVLAGSAAIAACGLFLAVERLTHAAAPTSDFQPERRHHEA